MSLRDIVVTNLLPSGTAFGATTGDTIEGVFIPSKVADATSLSPGQYVKALLVPNTQHRDRTPWLAARVILGLEDDLPADPSPTTSMSRSKTGIKDAVKGTLREGGVWTVTEMYRHLFPDSSPLTPTGGAADMAEIATAMQTMFDEGECAKFALWRSKEQTRPNREWFTCHPDRADVDEWE